MSCFTHKYPYSSNRELNLDWLIKKINARKVLNLEVVENVGGGYDLVIYFADSDPVTVHLFAAAEITAEDIYDLFEDSETITKALNDGKISFSAESSIYPVIYGQTSYADALAALTAGKQLIAFYHEDNKYIQIPFKTKNVDTMNFSTVIDDIEDGKIVIRLALNQLTGWDSRIQPLVSGYDLLTLIDDTETIVADLNEDNHLELSASYENIVQPLARSLKTPVSAPAEKKLVGFDENRDQMNLGIGNGLKIENDDLKINEEELPKQTPLTPVDSLPVANETEYEKHLLYETQNTTYAMCKGDSVDTLNRLDISINNVDSQNNRLSPLKRYVYHNGLYYFNARSQTNRVSYLCSYDINTNTFKTVGQIASGIISSGFAIWIDNNNIMVAAFTENVGVGNLKIFKYNPIDETFTTITTFPGQDSTVYSSYIHFYNGNIYSFGSRSGNAYNYITKYNIANVTITTLQTTLPTSNDYVRFTVDINNKVYIQRASGKLYIFNMENETVDSEYIDLSSYLSMNITGVLIIPSGFYFYSDNRNLYYLNLQTKQIVLKAQFTTSFSGGSYGDKYIFIPQINSTTPSTNNILELNSVYEYFYKEYITDKTEEIHSLKPVTTLPTANATEYAKHLLYLDTTDGKLKYIVFDGSSTYSYKSIATETE